MDTPFIRAKARDSVDALDNVTAYLDPGARQEIADYVTSTLADIERVMEHAVENGTDPVAAFKSFATRFHDYWEADPS
jgi:hypothetical protein